MTGGKETDGFLETRMLGEQRGCRCQIQHDASGSSVSVYELTLPPWLGGGTRN